MKSPKILFRTGGGLATNTELGFGHLHRSINLALEFKKSNSFFLVEDFGGAKNLLLGKKIFNFQILPKKLDLKKDIEISKNFINKYKIDILVIDRYKINLNYIKQMKKICKVVIISDLLKINFPGDLVVNGYIGHKNKIIQNKLKTKCLLGPKYQILDKRFSCLKISSKSIDLLITVGGFDEKNSIDKLLDMINEFLDKISVKIILGFGVKTPKIKKYEKLFKSNIKVINYTNNMKNEMEQSRFAICAGGITSYEYAVFGKYFGIICTEKHQLKTANEWEKKGYAKNLGLITNLSNKKINKFLDIISENKKLKVKSDIDGMGRIRVKKEILKL